MFRIKTDIRQFNCETQEKVEKLIRNWVIRPTDLIYDADGKSWDPIGDHADFGDLFLGLRDGVDEEDLMTTTELDQISESLDFGEASESSFVEESAPEALADDAPDKPKPSGSMRAAILSGRGKIKKLAGNDSPEGSDDEEDAPLPLPIPTAPEGVEGVANSADEVTIMTERTAELLGFDDEEEMEAAAKAREEELAQKPELPSAPEGVEGVAVADEPTNIFARDDEDEEEEPERDYILEEISSPSEASDLDEEDSEPRLGRHDLPEELFLTNELERPEDILAFRDLKKKEPLLDELPEEAAPEEDDKWADEVTQQIESPLEAEEPAIEVTSDVDAGWDALMEEDEEEIRETIELDSPISRDEIAEQPSLQDQLAADRASGDRPASDRVLVDADYSREADEESEAVESVDTQEFSTELLEASSIVEVDLDANAAIETSEDEDEGLDLFSSPTAPPPEDDIEIEVSDTLDGPVPPAVADLANEPTDEFSEEALRDILDEGGDASGGNPAREREFVSEGYTIPFPFEIKPSKLDLESGLILSDASDEEKDIAFPRPLPKKLGEVVQRRYGYGDPPSRVPGDVPAPGVAPPSEAAAPSTPPNTENLQQPRDYSKLVILGLVLFFILIVATFALISSS